MKKLLYLILLLGFVSCGESTDSRRNNPDVSTTWVNGHEYVLFTSPYRGNSIVHSASCPCELKTLEDSIHYFEDGY